MDMYSLDARWFKQVRRPFGTVLVGRSPSFLQVQAHLEPKSGDMEGDLTFGL